MYVYIKRFHFICKISFFSLFLFFFPPTENDDEVKGESKLHDSFQNGSRFPLKMGRGWVVIHTRSQLVLYKKREYN